MLSDAAGRAALQQLGDVPAVTFNQEAAMVRTDPSFAPDIVSRVEKIVNDDLEGANGWQIGAVNTHGALIDALLDLAPPELRVFIEQSTERPLVSEHIGWVKLAFSYAVYELATGTDFEESLVRTIGRGGDTDTNAAIVGAVLGGVYGSEGIPQRWRDTVEKCTPGPGTLRPRPEEYWPPADVEDMAASLRQCGE